MFLNQVLSKIIAGNLSQLYITSKSSYKKAANYLKNFQNFQFVPFYWIYKTVHYHIYSSYSANTRSAVSTIIRSTKYQLTMLVAINWRSRKKNLFASCSVTRKKHGKSNFKKTNKKNNNIDYNKRAAGKLCVPCYKLNHLPKHNRNLQNSGRNRLLICAQILSFYRTRTVFIIQSRYGENSPKNIRTLNSSNCLELAHSSFESHAVFPPF